MFRLVGPTTLTDYPLGAAALTAFFGTGATELHFPLEISTNLLSNI